MKNKHTQQTEIKICKYCKLPFPRMKKLCSKGRLPKGIRRKGSVTCSRKCSRNWARMKPWERRERK